MNDKELLELAAKAADVPDANIEFVWNPLTQDGDALRLAVKLGLCMTIDLELGGETEVWEYGAAGAYEVEPNNGDPYAATRRAIVRAAAEIGKEMK